MADELERSSGDDRRPRFTILVRFSGPVTIKVTGTAVALVLVLIMLVSTWYLSR